MRVEQELSRLKTQFMNTAAHEIRTPSTSIQGYTEIIQSHLADSDDVVLLRYFDAVARNTERLDKLSNDLLDLQRIEAGKMRLDLESVPVSGVLKRVEVELTPILAKKDQKLYVSNQLGELKIMVVLIDENGRPCNIETKKGGMIQELSENDRYKKILVVGESLTRSAHNILRHNDKVDTITSKARFSLISSEILSVFTRKNDTLSKELHGDAFMNARNIYKNAEFHAKMGWKDQLLNDFTQLMKLQTESRVDQPH